MRTLILGGDGYLGWPTALYLSEHGHEVAVLDNFARRGYDAELGLSSLVPIASLAERTQVWRELTGIPIATHVVDLTDPAAVEDVVASFRPDAIVHYGEQRAAPYSMIDREHAAYTQVNNVVGTLNVLYAIAAVDPAIHLIKLGTMGEYGTPNIDIEEGWLDLTHRGRTDRVLYPKRAGSFYHLSKVHDSHNIEFATRVWGLRATDLNQGIVYGCATDQTVRDERLQTRLDYDGVFGTVLNRFAVQAVLGHPLSVYGSGGQSRGLIDLRDTIECIRLAAEHPAAQGEFRVFNQMTQSFSLMELARIVVDAFPGEVSVERLPNPRVELEEHYYNVVHTALPSLGLRPHLLDQATLRSLFDLVDRYRERVDLAAIPPFVRWQAVTSGVKALV